jgi:hypothetical protein
MGAHGARGVLVRLTPKDRGQLKAGWRSRGFPEGKTEVARVSNDAPYAGVVELGARPHQMSMEGRVALAGWVRRHFPGMSEAEVWSMVQGIANKIANEGQAPTYFVRNAMPDLTRLAEMEIKRALGDVAKQGTKGGR